MHDARILRVNQPRPLLLRQRFGRRDRRKEVEHSKHNLKSELAACGRKDEEREETENEHCLPADENGGTVSDANALILPGVPSRRGAEGRLRCRWLAQRRGNTRRSDMEGEEGEADERAEERGEDRRHTRGGRGRAVSVRAGG